MSTYPKRCFYTLPQHFSYRSNSKHVFNVYKLTLYSTTERQFSVFHWKTDLAILGLKAKSKYTITSCNHEDQKDSSDLGSFHQVMGLVINAIVHVED